MIVQIDWDHAARRIRVGPLEYADDFQTGRCDYGGLLASAALTGHLPSDQNGACDVAAALALDPDDFVRGIVAYLVSAEKTVTGGKRGRPVEVNIRRSNPASDLEASGVVTHSPVTVYHPEGGVIVKPPDLGVPA